MGLGQGAGEGPQGILGRSVGFMTALEDFRVWSLIDYTKRVCYSEKRLEGIFSVLVTELVRLQHFWLFNQDIH